MSFDIKYGFLRNDPTFFYADRFAHNLFSRSRELVARNSVFELRRHLLFLRNSGFAQKQTRTQNHQHGT
jgi:hypothetical protein